MSWILVKLFVFLDLFLDWYWGFFRGIFMYWDFVIVKIVFLYGSVGIDCLSFVVMSSKLIFFKVVYFIIVLVGKFLIMVFVVVIYWIVFCLDENRFKLYWFWYCKMLVVGFIFIICVLFFVDKFEIMI